MSGSVQYDFHAFITTIVAACNPPGPPLARLFKNPQPGLHKDKDEGLAEEPQPLFGNNQKRLQTATEKGRVVQGSWTWHSSQVRGHQRPMNEPSPGGAGRLEC